MILDIFVRGVIKGTRFLLAHQSEVTIHLIQTSDWLLKNRAKVQLLHAKFNDNFRLVFKLLLLSDWLTNENHSKPNSRISLIMKQR